MRVFKFFLSLGFLVAFSSCSDDGGEGSSVRFGDMFENMADNIIQPRYAAFSETVDALYEKADAFQNDPTDYNLSGLKTAFHDSYMSWQTVSAFGFGPADAFDTQLRVNLNSFPANTSQIQDNVANSNYNMDLPVNIEAKGYPALDFMLYGWAADENQILDSFVSGSTATQQKAYLMAVVTDMKTRVDKVVAAWPAYRDAFVNSTGSDQNSSLSLTYNAFLVDYEQVKRNKLGLPAGFATNFGIAIDKDPTAVEGYYSVMSVALAVKNIQALDAYYHGTTESGANGEGYYEKLKEYNAMATVVEGDLADAIDAQFELVESMFSQTTFGLPQLIESDNQQLKPLSDELQKMVPMLKNDMRSYFSVTITASDSDGD